jgi:hypothetical protein
MPRRKPRFSAKRPWPREVAAGNAWLTFGNRVLTAQPARESEAMPLDNQLIDPSKWMWNSPGYSVCIGDGTTRVCKGSESPGPQMLAMRERGGSEPSAMADDAWEGMQIGRRAREPEQLDYFSDWDRLRARAWLIAWERYA